MARRGRMGRGVAPTEKAKDFKGTMKKLIRYMASFKIQIFFVAVFAICGTILILPDQRFSERRQQKSSMVLSVRFQADQAWILEKSERFWRQH